MDAERTLLFDNKGCFKCCCFLVNHCSANCPNDFPAHNYKTLTSEDVNTAHHKTGKTVASIMNTSCGSGSLLIVVIMPPTNNSPILEGDSANLSKDLDVVFNHKKTSYGILRNSLRSPHGVV